MEDKIVAHVTEVRTDGEDIVKEWVEIVFAYKNGEEGSLKLTLEAAYELRAVLDAVPEIDGANW